MPKPKKLKPIIRIPGSKFRKLDLIIDKFDFPEHFRFFEPFGGSLIIAANVKNKFPHADVNVNDFDKFYDLNSQQFDRNKLVKNQTSYAGLNKNFTQSAQLQFDKRIKNGYWELLESWNEIFLNINLQQMNWLEFLARSDNQHNSKSNLETYIFVDPPYVGDKYSKLYPHQVDHNLLFKWLKSSNYKILITLNDTIEIREIFKDWHIQEVEFTYTLTSNKRIKREKELFISNF